MSNKKKNFFRKNQKNVLTKLIVSNQKQKW